LAAAGRFAVCAVFAVFAGFAGFAAFAVFFACAGARLADFPAAFFAIFAALARPAVLALGLAV
jgi:hypothetical protein